jgi:hypothetical protein
MPCFLLTSGHMHLPVFLTTYSQGGLTPEEEREAARVAGSARAPALHSEVASHIALTPAAAAMVGGGLRMVQIMGIRRTAH